MRSISIIGAGQAGLQLGIALKHEDYDVTVISNRTAEEVKNGPILSSQIMFDMALQNERDLALNFWDNDCPWIDSIEVNIGEKHQKPQLSWSACFDKPAQSIDQRLKIPAWMNEFERLGGHLLIEEAGVPELEEQARKNELVIIASGKGEINHLFKRDTSKSPFNKPMRALALVYATGISSHNNSGSRVSNNIIPNIGELFLFPVLTPSGPCHVVFFEAVPKGPLDCWQEVTSVEQQIVLSQTLIDQYFPWEAARCRNMMPCDDKARLTGQLTPTTRQPVATLPSGAKILGIADAVCLNDPITGQGSNNASKCAEIYLDAILKREDQIFDEAWMQSTFDRYWGYAQWTVKWTNSMLLPPTGNILKIMSRARNNPVLARRIANGFNDPTELFPWWEERAEAKKIIAMSTQQSD